MSTIKEEYIDENKLQDDAEVLEKFLSMKDAITNLKLKNFENFFKKHNSNIKIFSETKAKEFHKQNKVLINIVSMNFLMIFLLKLLMIKICKLLYKE